MLLVYAILLVLVVLAGFVEGAERSCRFAWEPVELEADGVTPETNLAGYRLYQAASAGGPYALVVTLRTDTLDDPSAPRALVPCDEGSYWVATAFDGAGNESVYSNEVVVPDVTPPLAPGLRLEEVTETSEEIQIRTTRTVRVQE